MRLIPNARKGYRMWSVQLGSLGSIVTLCEFVNQQVLPLWDGVIPDGALAAAGAALMTAALVGRFIIQKALSDG